jgi:HTH-type transcriptional regulator, sugar sensing transcriptional regulator
MGKEFSMHLDVRSPKSLVIDHDSLVSSQLRLLQPSSIAPAIDNEEIRALQLLGLTHYEAKVYLGLVKNGPLGVSELAFLSHVPRTKLYGVLRHLERKGLVHLTPSTPETFTAVSPAFVLDAKAREIADQAASVLETVQKLAEEYALKANSGGLELPVEANELWHIDGRKQIYDRVGHMLGRAVKSISYYATPAGLVRAYKAHADYLEKVGKRGVAVRVLAQTSKDVHLVTEELGAVVKIRRTTKPLAANFVCIDGRELVVIENSPGDFDVDRGTDRAAWTTNKLLVGLYENLFERVWESSSPLH